MGVRANALIDYRVPDHRNQGPVISLLAPTLTALHAVSSYWKSVQTDNPEEDGYWSATMHHPSPADEYLQYEGPGSFSIVFGEKVAGIHAGCRWAGFCTIPELQAVHVAAFRSVAIALGATRMILSPDYDPVEGDALFGGASLDDCVTALKYVWGTPYPVLEVIDESDKEFYKRRTPPWFMEQLTNRIENV